ncbi:MAG: hypothetical protein RQ760_02495 [Sedimentisphaerales bacterium]|nr:hypothetical protein [Sedimentisphaerales bacterium]
MIAKNTKEKWPTQMIRLEVASDYRRRDHMIAIGLFRFWMASGCIDHQLMACFAFLARNKNARSRCYDSFC